MEGINVFTWKDRVGVEINLPPQLYFEGSPVELDEFYFIVVMMYLDGFETQYDFDLWFNELMLISKQKQWYKLMGGR
jgi:hypothetical protein